MLWALKKVLLNFPCLHSGAAIAGHFIWNLLHNSAALMTPGSNVIPDTLAPESSHAPPCFPANFSRCPVEAFRICACIFTAEDVSCQNAYISQQMLVVSTLRHDRKLVRNQVLFLVPLLFPVPVFEQNGKWSLNTQCWISCISGFVFRILNVFHTWDGSSEDMAFVHIVFFFFGTRLGREVATHGI